MATGREAGEAWTALPQPFQRCLDLAWESARCGSLGIGAVITDRDGVEVASGRNRLLEDDAGEDRLAASPVAHAEMNALAQLRYGASHDSHVLWTSLEPCVLCAGGIRVAGIGSVRFIATDPIWEGVHRMRDLCPNAPDRWPVIEGPLAGPLAAFGALLPMHVAAFWLGHTGMPSAWTERLPGVAALAAELATSGELVSMAAEVVAVPDVLDVLWLRLAAATATNGSRVRGRA